MRWIFSSPAKIDHDLVVGAIQQAEKRTSGQIQVLIARHRAPNPVAAALRHFHKLGMDKSRHRNAVLIFVAPRSRTFAVIGDRGIHEKCGEGFWKELALAMGERFKRGDFTAGLLHGIERAGALLAEHFPPDQDRENKPTDVVKDVD
jgi:uncharacterized membrane protein